MIARGPFFHSPILRYFAPTHFYAHGYANAAIPNGAFHIERLEPTVRSDSALSFRLSVR